MDPENSNLSEASEYAFGSVDVGQQIPEQWWTLFGDSQLNCLIEAALEQNPTIEEAQRRVNLAYEVALESRSKLLPYLDAWGEAERNKLSLYGFGLPGFIPLLAPLNRNFNWINMLLRGSWEIDIWGKNRNLFLSKLDDTTATYADMLQAKVVLATSVASAYFNLQSHQRQLEVLIEQAEDKGGVARLLNQRFRKGMADEFWVYREDSALALIIDQIERMRGIIESDKHALAALVANQVELEVVPVASFEKPFPLPACLPLELIKRRPDIRAQIWRIESSTKRVKAAKARFLPNLDLFGTVGFISFFWDRLVQAQTFDYEVGGNSTLPLYTGGDLCARLGQSEQEMEIAIAQYNQTLLKAVREVSDALSDLKTADERLDAINDALDDAVLLYDLTNQKYERGIETLVSLLNARYSVMVQELTRQEIELMRMEALVALVRSIGGGYGGE
ncbi:MAG: Outer membrane protein OprM [Chlamydiales bacterium]|nr:Outer membrane protein OprM [Chlamydiales bacterium]MCH9635803.1 Outer membrane protein OprM [Chlamydiales bacterium]